ncbi:MAG: pseudouridine synthase, partial [Bdellovibrionales bacterium]|nr:pseudouridine synthase [Bdellovibrionales bacterium]
MRINKFFTENGICSRREADRWVDAGRVSINGVQAKPGDQIPAGAVVALDGKPVVLKAKRRIVLAYHKPVGIECTADPSVKNNVISALNYSERVFYIGRLDVMSEGLLLLTNIGELADQIARARNQHEKEYEVTFHQIISDAQISRLRLGVDIGDEDRGLTLPCLIDRTGPKQVRVTLKEGRNRQIRRMAEAVGLNVARLKRVRVMSIHLG